MNLFLNNIEKLDHKNVYMIKRMIGSLLTEFNEAIIKKDIHQADSMMNITKQVYDKIKPNMLWARRVNMVLTDMARKLK